MSYELYSNAGEQGHYGQYIHKKIELGAKSELTSEEVCIPVQLPDIEYFVSIEAEPYIQEIRQVPVVLDNGHRGYKAVVEGKFHLVILYAAFEPTESVHMAEFDIFFNAFIPLKEKARGELQAEIKVEDVTIEQLDDRCGAVDVVWCVTVLGEEHIECYNSGYGMW